MGQTQTVGLDTSVVIYLVEQHPVYLTKVKAIFNAIEAGKYQAVFSAIGLAELLVGPNQAQRQDLVIKYQYYLSAYTDLAVIDLLPPIINLAAKLRAKYAIALPDAIHLATAITFEADTFITNDKALKKVKEIAIQLL